MTKWVGRTTDGSYGLVLEEPALIALDRMCSGAGKLETGGILVGRYSEDLALAIVRQATPPPADSRRARSWFNRGVAGLRELLRKEWGANERTYYLGEWHFHPVAHVVPSSDDFSQMVQIARAAEYRCREPLLVILGADGRDGKRRMRAFVCPAGCSPMELHPVIGAEAGPGRSFTP